jgi:hypothetical protein
MLAFAAGCSWGGPERVTAPQYEPSKAAQLVFDNCDANKDGQLAKAELDRYVSLRTAFEEIDKNADKSLSTEELENRINEIVADRVGSMSVACVVLKGSQPVPGVTVRFIPEDFVADVIVGAKGETTESGLAIMASEDPLVPGVSAGFYRVEISRQVNGRETIPAKFNSKSQYGEEISQSNKRFAGPPLRYEI